MRGSKSKHHPCYLQIVVFVVFCDICRVSINILLKLLNMLDFVFCPCLVLSCSDAVSRFTVLMTAGKKDILSYDSSSYDDSSSMMMRDEMMMMKYTTTTTTTTKNIIIIL